MARNKITHKLTSSPRRRRLNSALKRNDDPDLAILKQELEARDRTIAESKILIDRIRLELEEKRGEADALQRIGEAMGSAFDHNEMMKVTAEIAVQITGTDSCQIYLFDSGKEELVLRATDDHYTGVVNKIRLKLGEGITGWVAQERKPVAVAQDAWKDPRFKFFPEMQEGEYASMLSVPLLTHGDILGVINVRTRLPHQYTKGQIRLLSGIANQVAGVIQRSRRFKQLEKQASHLTTLSEVTQAITSNMYLDELLHLFVTMTARTMGYKIVTVSLLDHDKQELVLKATQSDHREYVDKPNVKIGESISGKAAAEQRVVTVLDLLDSPDYQSPEIARQAGIRSLISVPLMLKGVALGVLNCYTEKQYVFTREETLILQALATQAALGIEHAKLMVKSAVIQEMHHRVKNNLQQIVSLVRLEMRYSKYTTVDEALNDTLNRIIAISTVHELLTRDDLDTVSVRKVAESILLATQQSVVPPGKSISTEIEGDDFVLPLAKATSMALVLNELVQNAVEHGFKSIDAGRIKIIIKAEEAEYRVVVLNDGDALPSDFTVKTSDSLGLSIVDILVRGDLNGTFTLENALYDPGIVAVVAFPR